MDFTFNLQIKDNKLIFQVANEPEITILLKLFPEKELYPFLEKYINQGYNSWKESQKKAEE